ncbi:hypothetical protein [Microtetraspora niveoalba]|uniref:hypothetical protein n=1 Tax=Microtetraspora niveoalba TaxID=46175 RepID=UPI00082F86FE|nr:hypothetical protein [Microtetraspora niveoalba]
MARSFIEYRERGFWSVDAYVQIWLHLMWLEAGAYPEAPGWLAEARDYWRLQATDDAYGAWRGARLDEYVGDDPDRMAVVLNLVERVNRRVSSFGPAVPDEVLAPCGYAGSSGLINSSAIAMCGDAVAGLLKGEIGWDAAGSPVLGNLGWG